MRVLIADDQRSFGLTLADLVRYCGHDVVGVVGSGLDAINAYSLHHPDLVLMDYRMPKLNGGTACRHIIAKDPEARVILLSAWSPLDGADQSGAICFLPKPVDLERLSAALQNVERTLPPPAPVETQEILYPPESIDYFQPIAEPSPIASPASEPTFPIEAPETYLQPDAIDYFQPVEEPLPIAPVSSELTFPIAIDSGQSDLERTAEDCALEEMAVTAEVSPAKEKKSPKRRGVHRLPRRNRSPETGRATPRSRAR